MINLFDTLVEADGFRDTGRILLVLSTFLHAAGRDEDSRQALESGLELTEYAAKLEQLIDSDDAAD